MRVLVQNTLTNRQWVAFDGPAGFSVGRDPKCEVALDSRFVSSTHLRVERSEIGWEVELLPNVSPIEINGNEVAAGQKVQFREAASLKIMEFVLTLEDAQQVGPSGEAEEQLTDLLNVLHANVLRRLDLRLGAITSTDISQHRTDQLNKIIDTLLLNDFRREVFESELTQLLLRIAMRARVNSWLIHKQTQEKTIAAEWHGLGENTELEGPVEAIVLKLVNKAGIYTGKPIPPNADELIDRVFWGTVDAIMADVLENIRTYVIISYIKKTLYDIIFGLGPLEDLLRSPSITEIMVVNPRNIYIERNGRVVKNTPGIPLRRSLPLHHRTHRRPPRTPH